VVPSGYTLKTNQDSSSASGICIACAERPISAHGTRIDRVNASIYQKWQDALALKHEGRTKAMRYCIFSVAAERRSAKMQLELQRQGREKLPLQSLVQSVVGGDFGRSQSSFCFSPAFSCYTA
jgi:hypothetical protein